MAGRVKVTVKDKGWAKRLRDAKIQSAIKVGILDDTKGDEYDNGTTVSQVAEWNEFGIGVPERSFIRAWFDLNETRIKTALDNVVIKVLSGQLTEDVAMHQLGFLFQNGIQTRMANGVPPPNAQSTIAKKGSSTPLIDTGLLRSSITFEVIGKGGKSK